MAIKRIKTQCVFTRVVRKKGDHIERFQIKARRILPNSNPSQRVGGIKLDEDWDAVLLVLLDENFETTEIYKAERNSVRQALLAPGSKARNERGALAVSKFKSIGQCIWSNNNQELQP